MAAGFSTIELAACLKKKSGSADSNWSANDASAPGSGDKILLTAMPDLRRQIAKLRDESLGGETAEPSTLNGLQDTSFSLTGYLRYSSTAAFLPWAMCLGTSGTPSQPGGSLTYDQNYTPALNIDGLVATFGIGPTTSQASRLPAAMICPSTMFTSFRIFGSAGGYVMWEAQAYGIDVFTKPAPTADALDSDITLNWTEANIAAATVATEGDKVRFGDLKFYMDARTGGDDFASNNNHVHQISEFELNYSRDLDTGTAASQEANAPDFATRPIMPLNSATMPVPTLTITRPRWTSTEDVGEYTANTEVRIRLKFNGPNIESGYDHHFQIDLPNAKRGDHSRGTGGNITEANSFDCFQSPSTPTGFSSADYVRIDTRNKQSSDLLA